MAVVSGQKAEDAVHEHHLNGGEGGGLDVGDEELGYLSEGT